MTARLSRTVLSAVISGAYQDVEGLEASSVHLYVNAEGLEEGVYNAPVQCRVDGTETYDFTPQQPTVTLTITAETQGSSLRINLRVVMIDFCPPAR